MSLSVSIAAASAKGRRGSFPSPRTVPLLVHSLPRSSSLGSEDAVPFLSVHSNSDHSRRAASLWVLPLGELPKIHKPSREQQKLSSKVITKCFLVILFLTFSAYSSLVHLSYDFVRDNFEDQTCPIQRWNYPNCLPRSNEILQVIPTPDEWQAYREAYHAAVDDNNPQHFSLEPSTWKNGSATGFLVPIEVRYSPERGRGVFATAPIPKGTLIWDNRFTARIRNECEGKRFLQELTQDQACNVIVWGYAVDHGTGHLEWGIDLDPCSFTNKGASAADVNVEDIVVDPSKALEPGGHSMWSIRDISAGEELLSSYQDLHTSNPFKNLWWQVNLVFRSWGLGAVVY